MTAWTNDEIEGVFVAAVGKTPRLFWTKAQARELAKLVLNGSAEIETLVAERKTALERAEEIRRERDRARKDAKQYRLDGYDLDCDHQELKAQHRVLIAKLQTFLGSLHDGAAYYAEGIKAALSSIIDCRYEHVGADVAADEHDATRAELVQLLAIERAACGEAKAQTSRMREACADYPHLTQKAIDQRDAALAKLAAVREWAEHEDSLSTKDHLDLYDILDGQKESHDAAELNAISTEES